MAYSCSAGRREASSRITLCYRGKSDGRTQLRNNLPCIFVGLSLVLDGLASTVTAESTHSLLRTHKFGPHWSHLEFSDMFGEYILPTIFIGGSVLPYYPQYKEIQRTRDASGFSTLVSMILLSANIVRIFYWFGERFALSLLIQSVAVIIGQLLLLQLCVTVQNEAKKKQGIVRERHRRFLDFRTSDFWQWDDFSSYLQALLTMVLILSISFLLFSPEKLYIQILGGIALGIEAMLGVPQAYRNFVNKSTKGLSLLMVFSWLVGDAFKTLYFIYGASPIPFIACGAFQLFVDVVILIQIFVLYNKK